MKTALVTGSTRGIGRGIADALLAEGYAVVYSGTGSERRADIPADADYHACDISRPADREALFAYIRETYGRLDVLVNNAGVAPLVRRNILETDEESFDRVIGVNLKGTFFMCQLAARLMLECREADSGRAPRIINIGSVSAYASSPSRGEYCISKAGVSMVTKLFADQLAPFGIPVFEVRPGMIETDMTAAVHDKYAEMIRAGLTPIRRFGAPSDVAGAVLACCSGLLDFSAGQAIDADGGFSLRRL